MGGDEKKHKKHKHHKAEKELAKMHETDEEKRARRLAKKAAKEAKRQDDAEVGGYRNEANPWNDASLSEQFVWGKKIERDHTRGIFDSGSKEAQKRKREELEWEIRKVKQAREQRDRENEEREVERRMIEKERANMEFYDNEKREDTFQFHQSKERAYIRTKEGRARPIDLVSASLTLLDPDFAPEKALELELQEPMGVFHQLNPRELRELRSEISSYGEQDVQNASFWNAMAHICERKLQEKAEAGGSRGVHSAVEADVDGMLRSKTTKQLDELYEQITQRLRAEEELDTDYWEAVLVQLQLARAKATLDGMYRRLVRRRTELCGGRPAEAEAAGSSSMPPPGGAPVRSYSPELEGESTSAAASAAGGGASGRFSPELLPEEEADYDAMVGEDDDEVAAAAAGAAAAAAERGDSGPGRYSPALLTAQEVDRDEAVDEAEDFRQLQARRARAKSRAMDDSREGVSEEVDSLVDAEARKGMDSGEARFSFEIPLEKKVAWWHDKYKPRKPKYFNRVHTGYEWNKYNQTHYDHDNPPPKMVQGYKFNLFYPDLIDRAQTPSYKLLADPSGAKDTCILRFHGGPPYEDVAFKVVNREWETSHKRGFRCRFERGILQLYFNFKRYRYRR